MLSKTLIDKFAVKLVNLQLKQKQTNKNITTSTNISANNTLSNSNNSNNKPSIQNIVQQNNEHNIKQITGSNEKDKYNKDLNKANNKQIACIQIDSDSPPLNQIQQKYLVQNKQKLPQIKNQIKQQSSIYVSQVIDNFSSQNKNNNSNKIDYVHKNYNESRNINDSKNNIQKEQIQNQQNILTDYKIKQTNLSQQNLSTLFEFLRGNDFPMMPIKSMKQKKLIINQNNRNIITKSQNRGNSARKTISNISQQNSPQLIKPLRNEQNINQLTINTVNNKTTIQSKNKQITLQQPQPQPQPQLQPQSQLQPQPQPQIHDIQQKTSNIPTSILNNLLFLYPIIPGHIIKLYLSQISKSIQIDYNDLVISFGIQQIIKKFYQTHQINNLISQKYILSEIDIILPNFISRLTISDWRVIRRIGQGLYKRFMCKQKNIDQVIIKIISKKKHHIRQNGVDVQKFFEMIKASDKELQDFNRFPTDEVGLEMFKKYNYHSIVQFLSNQPDKAISFINLQPLSTTLAYQSQKQSISTNLNYYLQLMEDNTQRSQYSKQIKSNQSNANKSQQNDDSNRSLLSMDQTHEAIPQNQNTFQIEIVIMKATMPQKVIIYDYLWQLQTENLLQDQLQDNKQVKKLGNKSLRIKAKQLEKQREKQIQIEKYIQKQAKTARKTVNLISTNFQKTINQQKSNQVSNNNKQQIAKNVQNSQKQKSKIQSQPKNRSPSPIPITESPTAKSNTMNQKKILTKNEQEQIMKKMDKYIFTYNQKYPEFTMTDLVDYIGKKLKNQLHISQENHKYLIQNWLSKYQQ